MLSVRTVLRRLKLRLRIELLRLLLGSEGCVIIHIIHAHIHVISIIIGHSTVYRWIHRHHWLLLDRILHRHHLRGWDEVRVIGRTHTNTHIR